MSQKYIIGLTGNIATGKSIVRRMLQELGASTIDADSLVHLLQKPGTPVHKKIIETFGTFILNADKSINRKRLGDIVFSSPEAMQTLEAITHPAVRQHIERAIERAPTYVIVIEAIKLLESGLAEKCDAVWVVNASQDTQMMRLMSKRKLSSQDALRRIEAQPAQNEKIAKANVVVENEGDLIETWNMVQKKFNEIPQPEAPTAEAEAKESVAAADDIQIRRAKRTDLMEIAKLISEASQGAVTVDEVDMMERLFSKGYLVALHEENVIGVLGWQTENLLAGIDDFFVKDDSLWASVGIKMIENVEEEVAQLSCEAGFIYLHNKIVDTAKKAMESKGYQVANADDLKDRMWREAAHDWAVENSTMMYRQLMERRINTPM
ncbi:MAG: dephospho-CoA kinase [Chloroflexota bacterium]